ncbi:MAG: hypothetical protein VX278_22015, partial [Myxococcota bacterium]|nr:hypothetical protein [Myxococcota bacterium]
GIRQSLAYPTLLLNTLARVGIGGILPPDVNIPHIVSSDTRFLLSNALTDRFSITLRAQLNISSRFGESDFPHIPVPVVYPRTASYQGLATLGGGLFARYGLGDVEIRSDTQIWYMVGNDANWSAEQWLSVRWFAHEGFSVDGGVVGRGSISVWSKLALDPYIGHDLVGSLECSVLIFGYDFREIQWQQITKLHLIPKKLCRCCE